MPRPLELLVAIARLGIAEAVAYRVSLIVWILTTCFPLVSLILWGSLASDGPIAGYTDQDFVHYFVAAFLVRQVTSSWLVWDLDRQIRTGQLSNLLLRPVWAPVHFGVLNLAALPLRALLALPLALVILTLTDAWGFAGGSASLAWLPLVCMLAWLINFLCQLCVGCLAFWITSASSLYDLWITFYFVLSGYAIPISLFPAGMPQYVRFTPFYLSLGFAVDLLQGKLDPNEFSSLLGGQLIWVVTLAGIARVLWIRGVRVHAAVGA